MSRCERLEICPMFGKMSEDADKRMVQYCRGEWKKCARHIALQTLGPADTPRDLRPDDHKRLHQMMVQA